MTGAPHIFRLDAKTIAQARASSVLALDASAFGRMMTLGETAPPTTLAAAPPDPNEPDDLAPATQVATPQPATVAIVGIEGPLAQRAIYDLCGYVDGYDAIAARLQIALENPDVGAVVLRIDSPGGDAQGLEEAVRRMRLAVEQSGKPCMVYVDELAASAAYWIAAGVGDKVYAPTSGYVGSIGCISMIVDESKALEQEGIAVELVRDPPGKAEAHPAGPDMELARERAQEIVGAFAGRFVAAVAGRRGLSTKDVMALNGAVLGADAAVAAGLADGVSTLEGVVAMAGNEAAARTAQAKQIGDLTAQAEVGGQVIAALLASTGETSPVAALAKVETWKTAYVSIEQQRAKLAEEKAALDAAERRELLNEQITLGYEDPGTTFDPVTKEILDPWASLALDKLRARVEGQRKAPKAQALKKAPASTANGEIGGQTFTVGGRVVELSARELAICAELGAKPEAYARGKLAKESARAR